VTEILVAIPLLFLTMAFFIKYFHRHSIAIVIMNFFNDIIHVETNNLLLKKFTH